MELKETSVAILTADYFEESEVLFPYYRLLGQVGRLVVATPGGLPVKGKGGLVQFAPQAGFGDLSVADFHGVVVPGGFAPDLVRRSPEALEFVRLMDQAGKPVAMICHGAWVAVSADILDGRTVTSAPFLRPEVEGAGAKWVNEPVVVDSNFVTSRVPDDLDAWMNGFLVALNGVTSDD